MRKYKYTKETLDIALGELQSENVVQRKNVPNSYLWHLVVSCSERRVIR